MALLGPGGHGLRHRLTVGDPLGQALALAAAQLDFGPGEPGAKLGRVMDLPLVRHS